MTQVFQLSLDSFFYVRKGGGLYGMVQSAKLYRNNETWGDGNATGHSHEIVRLVADNFRSGYLLCRIVEGDAIDSNRFIHDCSK